MVICSNVRGTTVLSDRDVRLSSETRIQTLDIGQKKQGMDETTREPEKRRMPLRNAATNVSFRGGSKFSREKGRIGACTKVTRQTYE